MKFKHVHEEIVYIHYMYIHIQFWKKLKPSV